MKISGAIVMLLVSLIAMPLIVVSAMGSEAPLLVRDMDQNGVDAPSGRLLLRMPAADSHNDTPLDGEPAAEAGPPAEPSDDSTASGVSEAEFFGESVSGRMVFILDVSASMMAADAGVGEDYDGNVIANMTRLDAVKYETVQMLLQFNESDAFDFVLQAGAEPGSYPATPGNMPQISPLTDVWQGQLVQADDAMVAQAIAYVQGLTTWWGTPTYVALQRACADYGNELDKIVFLTDGEPYPATISAGPHVQKILEDFPGWFAPLAANGCELCCFQIGSNWAAGSFLQEFAAQNGASYVHIGN
ncbi:MAG: hypothetical protein L6Q71_11330 [Planctomycetes bacterium]|nr:hypothetical protein [Planctomycetota bacterium]NUQ34214.1 hypothetical protein [Planctomycetaceae bacterium]